MPDKDGATRESNGGLSKGSSGSSLRLLEIDDFKLDKGVEGLFKSFSQLDSRISGVGQTAARIGDHLQNAGSQREAASQTIYFIKYLMEFNGSPEDSVELPGLSLDDARVAEATAVAQKLRLVSEEGIGSFGGNMGPANNNTNASAGLEDAVSNLQEYCNELEIRLLSQFDSAAQKPELSTMAECAKSLRQFNRGASAMQRYVASQPMSMDLEIMNVDTRTVRSESGQGGSPNSIEWLGQTCAIRELEPDAFMKSEGLDSTEIEVGKGRVGTYSSAKEAETANGEKPGKDGFSEAVDERLVALANTIRALESELEFKRSVSSNLLQSLLERNSYIQSVEVAVGSFSWPEGYPSAAPLNEKVEWLGYNFAAAEEGRGDSEESRDQVTGNVEDLGSSTEAFRALKETLAAKQAALTRQASRDKYKKDVETVNEEKPGKDGFSEAVDERLVALANTIRALESELEFKRSVSSNLLQSLLERNSYIQSVEVAVGSFSWPEGYPSAAPLNEKVEWLGYTFAAAEEGRGDSEESRDQVTGNVEDLGSSTESFRALKETLAAKQAALTRQASRDKYEKDAALRETRDRIADLENAISVLESDLEFNRGVSSGLQESLLESNSYIQMVEGMLNKFAWPGEYPLTGSLSNKVEWLGETFGLAKQGLDDEAKDKKETCQGSDELYSPSKEVLVAKLAALTSQFSEQKSERDVALLEAHKRIVAMEKSIGSLESELEVKKEVSFSLQQSLLEENRYIQMVEATLDKFSWPDSYPSTAPLNDKIEWLVESLATANREIGNCKQAADDVNTELKELSEKLVSLNTELACVKEEKEALAVKYSALADQILEETSGRDAALREAHESISALESELELERKSLSALQESLLERSSHLQVVEGILTKFIWPDDFPSLAPLQDRILWLAETVTSAKQEVASLRMSADLVTAEMEDLHGKAESHQTEKEALLAKCTKSLENEQLVSALQETLASRELELAKLRMEVEEIARENLQDSKIQSLLQEVGRTAADLEDTTRERDTLKTEVCQMRQKLSGAREKVGMGALVGSSELNSMEPLHEIDWVVLECARAKEAVSLWMKRAVDAETRAVSDRARYDTELEDFIKEKDTHGRNLVARLEEMEDILQQKESFMRAMEIARGKVATDFTELVEQLSKSRQQSEALVSDMEKLEKTLEDRGHDNIRLQDEFSRVSTEKEEFSRGIVRANIEILQLREELEKVTKAADVEITGLKNEVVSLQKTFDGKGHESEQQEVQSERKIHKEEGAGEDVFGSKAYSDGTFEELEISSNTGGLPTVDVLQGQIESLVTETNSLRDIAQRRDSQLQRVMKELEALQEEKALLQAGLQSKQCRIERLELIVGAIGATSQPAGADTHGQQQLEIEEVEPRSMWALASGPIAAHVRGSREFALEVDNEESNSLLFYPSEKGHGFKSLVNSRIVPKATRSVAERFDVLCVGAGRLLMRQPTARLALTAYWIFIHVWIIYSTLFTTKCTRLTQL